ncbi:SIR2 family protein [Phenylobacterium sp.]|uniref:SIR2 family protein n=1 Tax=Phenylobacterium sp. TaxID=1871053 RepID=UPI003BAC1D73
MDKTIELFLRDYLKELEAGNAAIFAGAGLSAPAGFVDWRELLRGLADELDLNIDLESDLVSVAQFHVNAAGDNRNRLNQAVIDALAADNPPTHNHRTLARLPISTWWTTNYDQLIERALRDAGKIVDVKVDTLQLANTRPRRDAIVYKMHGDVDRPNEAVLTRDDYEGYNVKRGAFTSALAGDLVSKTFLFLGFSFTDPNLEQVLSKVRLTFQKNQRRHFALFRRRARLADETEDAFVHAQARQLCVVADLKRYNVEVIFVDSYDQIDEILTELERRYRRRTVFISASASDFSPWGEAQVAEFMRELGAGLVRRDLRIATGLGLGVGNSLFTGAVEQILAEPTRHIEDVVTLRPFPQATADMATLKSIWESFRQEMIGRAGVGLFLFGNKGVDADGPIPADGMEREYAIAQAQGLVLLPIGATGSTAAQLAMTGLAVPERLPNLPPAALQRLTALATPRPSLAGLAAEVLDLVDAVVKS